MSNILYITTNLCPITPENSWEVKGDYISTVVLFLKQKYLIITRKYLVTKPINMSGPFISICGIVFILTKGSSIKDNLIKVAYTLFIINFCRLMRSTVHRNEF